MSIGNDTPSNVLDCVGGLTAQKSAVSTAILFESKRRKPTTNERYQDSYQRVFRAMTLHRQIGVIANLGSELGEVGAIFELPKELAMEIIGAAATVALPRPNATRKWYYFNKLTEVYNYLAEKESHG